MKISLQQLESQLTKNIAPIYLVSSDELLLVQETVDLIEKAAKNAGFTERTLIAAESNSDWGQSLYSSTHCMSLFAAKQLVELNLHHTKFSANTTKALQEYASNPPTDAVLIIRTNKVDGKTEKSAWFQALEKKSVFISLWPIPAAQLPQWISQRAKKQGMTLSKDSAELIANQVEGNLLAAAQEIEKLFLYELSNTEKKSSTSSLSVLKDVQNDNARFNVFDLVDSVLAENHKRSLRILNNLAAEDTEPTLILWALTREMRTLTEIIRQIKKGISLATLFNQLHVFEKRQALIRNFVQRHTYEQCTEWLLKSAAIDRIIKGVEKGSVWDEFEKLILM